MYLFFEFVKNGRQSPTESEAHSNGKCITDSYIWPQVCEKYDLFVFCSLFLSRNLFDWECVQTRLLDGRHKQFIGLHQRTQRRYVYKVHKHIIALY